MKTAKRRLDVNLEELDRVHDGAKRDPLSDDDHDKLKGVLHALVAMLARCWEKQPVSGRNRMPKRRRNRATDAMAPRHSMGQRRFRLRIRI